jgi:hypothetical protein
VSLENLQMADPNDYSGDLIEPAAVRSCVSHANLLLTTTRRWLGEHRPDLLEPTP